MKERNEVVLVDMYDREIGRSEKLAAHREGLLHRAFSVFLYRSGPHGRELLLQKRACGKYHCGGLWTNTCCSHPGAGEDVEESARRRLTEELGIGMDRLQEIHRFVYRAEFANGLTEFEYDHVFLGEYDGPYTLDPEEVDEITWVSIGDLMEDLRIHADRYTPWFLIAVKYVVEEIVGL